MTEDETKDYETTRAAMLKDAETNKAEQQAKAQAKQAVLAKLGLTADEVAALLS